MASIAKVSEVITNIVDGIEKSVLDCMEENQELTLELIREQLYSGVDGSGAYLSPTYDDDPFFKKKGRWQNKSEYYKKWKMEITPPESGLMTRLSPRPSNVPNLFIDGTFYSSIRAARSADGLTFSSNFHESPSIRKKYGDNILNLTDEAKTYFIDKKLYPHIEDFFKTCGYK